jgi:hypothetical protein
MFFKEQEPSPLHARADKYILINYNRRVFAKTVWNLKVQCSIIPSKAVCRYFTFSLSRKWKDLTYINTTPTIITIIIIMTITNFYW